MREGYDNAAPEVVDRAMAFGEGRSTKFANILARARAAGQSEAVDTQVAQHEARADLLDALMEDADQAGALKVDGVQEVVTQLVRNRWAYTSYTTAKLDAVRTALLKTDNPAARAVSPTSYQTAPPRGGYITLARVQGSARPNLER